MNICNYYDRLEIENGELVRIIKAVPKSVKKSDLSLDVYKEYEYGACKCRNLYTSMSGYRVAFPNEITSLYSGGYCSFEQKLDPFSDCSRAKAFFYYSERIDDNSKRLILEKYPDFKYVLKKWTGTLAQTLEALYIWKEHKEIEFVLAAGWTSLALNKSFWRLSEQKRKDVISFKKHNPKSNMSFSDIQIMLKYALSKNEFDEYYRFCSCHTRVKYDVYKYLKKIGKADYLEVCLYKDYLSLLNQTTHNSKEDYWRYPKDLQKKHDDLLVEVGNVKRMKELEEMKKKQAEYTEVVKNLFKLKLNIDGYSVFVPETIEEIQRQATILHQCLIANDYVTQVIRKSCVLVFIQKDDMPVATCQLLKGNKIGQFYADEYDRNNCLPSEEVKTVMNKWIAYKRSKKCVKTKSA